MKQALLTLIAALMCVSCVQQPAPQYQNYANYYANGCRFTVFNGDYAIRIKIENDRAYIIDKRRY